jgi:hypothetical protein
MSLLDLPITNFFFKIPLLQKKFTQDIKKKKKLKYWFIHIGEKWRRTLGQAYEIKLRVPRKEKGGLLPK